MAVYHVHFHSGHAEEAIPGIDCVDCRPKPHDFIRPDWGSGCAYCDRLPGDEVHRIPEWVRRAGEHRLSDQRPGGDE